MSDLIDRVLGIDFGTTYSSAGALINGKVELVVDGGEAAIPTVVHLPWRGPPLVGDKALARAQFEPEATIASFKRILGRPFADPAVARFQKAVPFPIKPSAAGNVTAVLRGEEYTCEQLCGLVLRHLKGLAEARFGGTVSRAIIAIPVTAGVPYIASLREGAKLAGVELVMTIREPIAGALAAGLLDQASERRILVCDFGGGTFDCTIMEQRGAELRALACDGEEFLGGDDFDTALADGIAHAFFKRAALDKSHDPIRQQMLARRCESIKRLLSTQREAHLNVKEAYLVDGEAIELDLMIERSWAEGCWAGLVGRAVAVVERLLATVGWDAAQVDHLVLVGGTTMVQLVRRTLAGRFPEANLVTGGDLAHLAIANGTVMETATLDRGRRSSLPTIAPDAVVTGPMVPVRLDEL